MLHLRCARLLAVVVLLTPACGKKSSSSQDAIAPAGGPPPVVIYQVKDIQLSSLQVDSRQEKSGDLTNDVAVQVNFPIRVAFGITQSGGTADTQISFGLMQQLTAEEAAAAGENQRHCFLGSTSAHHPGDGNEMHYEATFTVPPECVVNNEATTYNLYAGIDVPGQVETTEAEDDGNVVIFNEDYLEETRNQACKRGDGTAGCILSVTVNPSPGMNLAFAEMELESSVAVLEPLDENTGGTDDDGKPVAEVHTPLAKVISTVTLAGVNTEDATAITDKNGAIKYDICPESQFHDTCGGAGWRPLTVSSVDSVNARSGHEESVAVPELTTAEPKVFANHLFAEGETYTAIATGDWAVEEKFIIRGCLSADVEEKVSGTDDGTVAKLDNCKTEKVAVVRSTNAFRKSFATINHFTGTTNAYTFAEELVIRAGDRGTIRVDTIMKTENVMNLEGASSHNELSINLAGKANVRAAQTYAKAAAYVSVVGSYIELQQNMFQVALYHFRKQVPDEYNKEALLGYAREKCATFGYNALVIVLQGSMCVGGKAGLEGVLNVKAIEGGAAPFDAAQRTGIVTVTVSPIATIYASTEVVGDATVARGILEGNLRLIEMKAPVAASLQWGLTSLDPTVLSINGKVKSTAEMAVLDGEINVYADLREVDMCSRSWKICGKRHRIHYPCGFRWDRKFDKTLVDFTGDKRRITLLSRNQTLTLQ